MISITGLPATHETYTSAILVELEEPDGTKYRYTSSPGAVTYTGSSGVGLPDNGSVFSPEPLSLSGLYRGGGQVVGTVKFPDIEDTIKALAQVNRIVDWTCRVWRVGLDPDDWSITWIRSEAEGAIVEVDWSLGETKIEVDSLIETGEADRYTEGCQYVFGGARCGFAGVLTAGCDHTFTACTGYANQERYGGFRRLPKEGATLPEWGGVVIRYESR